MGDTLGDPRRTPPDMRRYSRRALLATTLLVPLAACATKSHDTLSAKKNYATSATDSIFVGLENRYGARVGIYALDTGTGTTIAYRADDRFAFCSTFKGILAAAVLQKYSPPQLDRMVTFSRDDIRSTSPITEQHVDTGMTLRELCDAAVRYSDGSAANLLLDDLGGPTALNAYIKTLGDGSSTLDQEEPELNSNAPGDQRDTTTPRALATDYQQLVLGDALPPEKRAVLTDWLERCTTGANRIRSSVPSAWRTANKTGSGNYGRANDIAVLWPPERAPIVLGVMSDCVSGDYAAEPCEKLIAEAAAHIVASLDGA